MSIERQARIKRTRAGLSGRGSHRVVVALAVVLGLASWTSSATAGGTFGYRKAIVFSGAPNGVSGGPHANFPVLVSLVDPDLKAKVASPSGYDVVFVAEDSTTCGMPAPCTLAHEIERWDGATGELVAWVRVPSLSAGTTIYMYYGNPQVASPTETPRAVWDAGYVGVWHLREGGKGNVDEYRDSSRYGNSGRGGAGISAAVPVPLATGKIGPGQHFGNADGTYDFIDAGDDATLRITGNQITLEAWVKHNIAVNAAHGTPPATGNPYGILNAKGWNDGYSLWLLGDSGSCGGAITHPCVAFNLPGRTDQLKTPSAAPLGPNQWHHVVATYDGATMSLYVDGANQGSRPRTGNISPTVGGEAIWIGQADQPENQPWSGQLEGDLDEVRISRVARSSAWIATEFNDQNAPGTFYSVGAEAPGAYSPQTLAVNYRSIGTNPGVLYATGTASAPVGATSVVLTGATLPLNVGAGDVLTFTGSPAETLYVLSRDSATQLTLQGPAVSAHAGQTYSITRAYNTLAAWQSDRKGDLVREDRREIGVAYNDGALVGGVTIDNSTTDPAHYMMLTAAPGQRHLGRAGTGVVLDNGTNSSPAIRIVDDFASVEWLEIKGGLGPGAHAIEIRPGSGPANLRTLTSNVIHDTGGDGVRLSDPDAIVDIENSIVYRAAYGIHFPVDLSATARANVFNDTIYGSTAAPGPSGVKSDVRQTSTRIDLRNDIAHSNAGGDFGISPFFDRGYFCNPSCTQVANGGVLGPTEYLADRSQNLTLSFTTVATSCLYLGSASKFRGVNVGLATPGVSSGADLLWSYWNGTAWTSLEALPFNDGTGNLVWEGTIYWPDDPPGWQQTSVSLSPSLYYVRACLATAGYSTLPIEAAITRVDVAIPSRNDLSSDITGRSHSARWAGQTGLNLVPLPGLFVSTTLNSEDLHIPVGSPAQDAGYDLSRVFFGDIDGALRTAPWDIGADEASASSGPDLAITKTRTSPPPVVPGNPIAYSINVTNNGPGVLTSLTLTDTLPPGIQVPAYTPSTGTYDPATGTWAGLSLGPSQSIALALLATVDPRARGPLVNTARVDPPVGVTDPNPANDSATVSDALMPSADLALAKAADADPAALGGLLTYTLSVTNSGPSTATGVVLTDPLPAFTEFDSVTSSQGTCSFDVPTSTLTCPLGDIGPSNSVTVMLKVRPWAVGTLTNTASVTANEPDPGPGPNTAMEQTTVEIPAPALPFLTVTSTSGQNVLELLDPAGSCDTDTEVRWKLGGYPASASDGTHLDCVADPSDSKKCSCLHASLTDGTTYFYAAFAQAGAGPGRFNTGRPPDPASEPGVKWAFSTGVFCVAAPTVTQYGVIVACNDRAVYSMQRAAADSVPANPTGGQWPTAAIASEDWRPALLGDVVQSRSPFVPALAVGEDTVYLGAQDGKAYAINAKTGAFRPGWTDPQIGGVVQAAPAGIFDVYAGGALGYSYLLLGTRDDGADNVFSALEPATGAEFSGHFDNISGTGGIGIISGMAAVDYAARQVYFASHRSTTGGSPSTLWCLGLASSTPGPVFTLRWERDLGNIDGSPIVANGRVYVGGDLDLGSGPGTLASVDANNLTVPYYLAHGDGQVKGFVFPNRSSAGDLYFATDNLVWAVNDNGSSLAVKPGWPISLAGAVKPSSPVLLNDGYLYVGGTDGRLYEINVAGAPVVKSVQLGDGLSVVGAPSLDATYGLIHVGTEAGVFYAVAVPLP